jgi:hypothetical protein
MPVGSVCAPFSFANTGFGVSFFKIILFSKYDTIFLIFQSDKLYLSAFFLHNLLDRMVVFPMASSAVNSVTTRSIDRLLAFVEQTTTEVATLQNKFDQVEDLVEAFDGDMPPLPISSQLKPR